MSSGVNPVASKPKANCSFCGKQLSAPSLNLGLKRFCSEDCVSASMIGTNSTSFTSFGNLQKRPPVSSIASFPGTKPRMNLDDQDGESSRSSTADEHMRPNSSGSNYQADAYKPPKKKKKKGEDETFEWVEELNSPDFNAASVLQVKHAPLSRMWENMTVGMKLEVENKDVDYRISEVAFWVASVVKIQGYYVCLRYEGFGNDCSGDFWIHLCSESIHHVGWCANKGKPLIPPKSIAKKFSDWRSFLVHRLTGARTLPAHFQAKLESGLTPNHKVGDVLEVVDKNKISQLKVATVVQVVGKRLHVKYWDNNEDGGFWCHEESRLIHPEGWAATVGHNISCPPSYKPQLLPTTPYDPDFENMDLQIGMKLEAIDPLNLSAICAATIKQVMNRGYVMVRIDCYEDDASGFDWFCYHISSQSVFPCGFCRSNGIVVTPPTGYDKATFDWEDYFRSTNTKRAPIKPKEKTVVHSFVEGMKIEAADLMDPRLICVATISKVVGRLLKIHFDGWDDEYDQWMDARSPDIYPIGWCEMVKHRLEPPRPPVVVPRPPASKKAKKGKKKVVKSGKQPNSKTKNDINSTSVSEAGSSAALGSQNKQRNNIAKTSSSTIVKLDDHALTVENVTKIASLHNKNPGPSFNGNSEKKEFPSHVGKGMMSNPMQDQKLSISKVDNPCDFTTDPYTWSTVDVVGYLKANDCASHCDSFTKHGIDGKKLMALSKDQIVPITGMKVGPAVKIFELISQLKRSTSAAKARTALTK